MKNLKWHNLCIDHRPKPLWAMYQSNQSWTKKISNQIVISIFISLDLLHSTHHHYPLSPCVYPHTKWEIWDNRCYCCTHTQIYIAFLFPLTLYNVIRCRKIICGSCSRTWCNGGNWSYKDRLRRAWIVGAWKEDCWIYEAGKWFLRIMIDFLAKSRKFFF